MCERLGLVHPASRLPVHLRACSCSTYCKMFWSARRFTQGLWFALFSAPCTVRVTQALLWPWRCLLLGAALTLLCLTSTSFLRCGSRSVFGVFWMFCAAMVGCSAIVLLHEKGFDNRVTAGPICAHPVVLFTAVKAWGVWPDSMHSAVATTAAGLRGAFVLLFLSAGTVLSSSTRCMSWFSSRPASQSRPAGLMTIAARQRAMRTVRARRNVCGRAAAHNLLLALTVVVLALASVDSGAEAAKLRPWRQWPDLNGLATGKPSARDFHTMATTADGNLWLIGGNEPPDTSSKGDEKSSNNLMKFDAETKQWTTITTSGPSPSPVSWRSAQMAAVGNVLYLSGGSEEHELWRFSTAKVTWKLLETPAGGERPPAGYPHTMAAVGDVLYVHARSCTWRYSTTQGTWELVDTPAGDPRLRPSARYGHVMAAVGDVLFLHGGAINGQRTHPCCTKHPAPFSLHLLTNH